MGTRLRRWRLVAVVLTVLSAATVNTAPVLAATGTVAGTLRDDDTGWVAGGVHVHACGAQGCVGDAIAGPSGAYSLDVPAGGGWNVFTDGGCGPGDYARAHQYGVAVVANSVTTLDLHLTKKKGSIAGRLLDSAGKGVADVSLVVDNAETGGSGLGGTASGPDGAYAVPCLAAAGVAGSGTYYITSFPPAGSTHGQQQDAGIRVLPDSTTQHDVVLGEGTGSFSGRISCGSHSCGLAISVLVYCEGCTSAAIVATDPGGAYKTGPLRAGQKYDIHAVAPPGWDNEIIYGVAVRPGAPIPVNITLTPIGPAASGGLNGVIMDGDAGFANCLINGFGGTPGQPGGGWTDGDLYTEADGSFDSTYRLVPGEYLVFIVCPGRPQIGANDGRAIHVGAGGTTRLIYTFPRPPRKPEPRWWLTHPPLKERPIQ